MPFKRFLLNSIDFERIHQLILKTLLAERHFAEIIHGQPIAADIEVVLEPYGGLFDLGLLAGGQCLRLFEIKMWSGLSRNQLERQAAFLKQKDIKGFHVLLGTTDLQYFRNEHDDEIKDQTNEVSQKLGYEELIRCLAEFVAAGDLLDPVVQMALEYAEALRGQQQYLENAWQNPQVHPHHHYYSTYNKIQQFLLDEAFYIYTVNNSGGASYIMNDSHSWCGFNYKGEHFQIYQEMLDNLYMIRIYNETASSQVRNEVKDRFLKIFRTKPFYNLGWTHHHRASKWHKVAVYSPRLKSLADCESLANLLKQINPVLKEIARQI